jgi:hypothetical protein
LFLTYDVKSRFIWNNFSLRSRLWNSVMMPGIKVEERKRMNKYDQFVVDHNMVKLIHTLGNHEERNTEFTEVGNWLSAHIASF